MPTICFVLRLMEQAEISLVVLFPELRLEITQGAKTCFNLLSASSDIYHSVTQEELSAQQLGKGVSHLFLLHLCEGNITPQLIRCHRM